MSLPRLEDIRWHLARGQYPALGVVSAAAIVFLAWAAPLTYDEAFNRVYYAQFTPRQILDTYDVANNHLPFTVLQSLIPSEWLDWNPWTIRVFGVLFGVALIGIVLGIAHWRRSSPLIPVFIIAGSPLLVTYLFLARGYGFSSMLLVLAALTPVAVTERGPYAGPCLGAVLLGLGAWPLPTNVFVAPGWFLVVFAFSGLYVTAASGVVFVLVLLATLGPVEGQIVDRSSSQISDYHNWSTWFGDTLSTTSVIPALLAVVVVAAVPAMMWANRNEGGPALRWSDADTRLAGLCWSMCVSWFVVFGLNRIAGLQLPFVRTAVPALWLAVVGLVATIPRGKLQYAAAALLAPGCVLGILVWAHAVDGGDWQRLAKSSHTPVLYGTTPVGIRDLSPLGADHAACSSQDAWVCEFVSRYLQRSKITIDPGADVKYDPRLPCVTGSRRPPPPWQVNVFRRGKLLGVLCH